MQTGPATAAGMIYRPAATSAVAARRSRKISVLCKIGLFGVSGDRRRADAKTAGAPAGNRVSPTYFALESSVGSQPLGRTVD